MEFCNINYLNDRIVGSSELEWEFNCIYVRYYLKRVSRRVNVEGNNT